MKLIFENWNKFLNEKKLASPEEDAKIGAAISKVYQGGPGSVRAFMDSPEGKDPKVRQFLHLADQQYDGASEDDNVNVQGVESVPLNKITPTQSYIDLMQSVSFPLGSAENLKKAISSKKGHGPISISAPFVLDGHHRWSGQFAITPDGTISATNIALPGDANDKLSALQLAIAAIDPSPKDAHPSKGGGAATNILGVPAEGIYKKIMANVNKQTDKKAPGALLNDQMILQITREQDPVILNWAGLEPNETNDPKVIRDAIAKRVANNLSQLPQNEDAPDRPDMPQLDHPSIGGAKGYQKIKSRLATGDLNVVPPFTKSKAAE